MIDMRGYLGRIEKDFEEAARNNTANFLIYGMNGCGKTYSLMTAPLPMVIHSFDTGNGKTLKKFVKEHPGLVFIDSSFEQEDAKNPTQFRRWEETVNAMAKAGLFERIRTYVIDSGTSWQDCLLNAILKEDNRAGQGAQLQDYNKHQILTSNAIRILNNMPCHFIMTGHVDTYQDQADGKVHTSFLAYGKNKAKMPLMFDEVYFMDITANANKPEEPKRKFITLLKGRHNSRSRLSASCPHPFPAEIEPDIRKVLELAGYPYEDLPAITE